MVYDGETNRLERGRKLGEESYMNMYGKAPVTPAPSTYARSSTIDLSFASALSVAL